MENTKNEFPTLKHWLLEPDNHPSEKMIYKQTFWDIYLFVRDTIACLFVPIKPSDITDFDRWDEEVRGIVRVVGHHMSKSINLPALQIKYKNTTITFRNNFYDWEVMVDSDIEFILPDGLFTSAGTTFYYQGIDAKYRIFDKYEGNRKHFCASMTNNYQLYTFMFLISRQLFAFAK